jgi:hypothetical protein
VLSLRSAMNLSRLRRKVHSNDGNIDANGEVWEERAASSNSGVSHNLKDTQSRARSKSRRNFARSKNQQKQSLRATWHLTGTEIGAKARLRVAFRTNFSTGWLLSQASRDSKIRKIHLILEPVATILPIKLSQGSVSLKSLTGRLCPAV